MPVLLGQVGAEMLFDTQNRSSIDFQANANAFLISETTVMPELRADRTNVAVEPRIETINFFYQSLDASSIRGRSLKTYM